VIVSSNASRDLIRGGIDATYVSQAEVICTDLVEPFSDLIGEEWQKHDLVGMEMYGLF